MRKNLLLRLFLSLFFLLGIMLCSFSCMLSLSEKSWEDKKQEFELTVLSRHESIYFEWQEPEGVNFTNIRVECVSDEVGASNPRVYDRELKEGVNSYIRTGVTNDMEYFVSFTATGSDNKEYTQELVVVPHHRFPIVDRATAITFDGMTYVSFGVSPKNVRSAGNSISARVYREGIRVETIEEYENPFYEEIINKDITDNYISYEKYYGFVIDKAYKDGTILQIATADSSQNETVVYEVGVKSAKLPVVELILDLNDKEIENFKNRKEIKGQLSVYNSEEYAVDNLLMTIKGRGNSSWTNTPKKSYTVKFDKKQSFLGMDRHKNFALVANYFDKTLLRNTIAYDLSDLIFTDLAWTPDNINVNLFINGVYQGIYGVAETVKIDRNRIPLNETNIENYEKGTDFDKYGYILEVNTRLDEDFNFVTNYDPNKSMAENKDCVAFSLKEPDASDIDELMTLKYGKDEGLKVSDSVKNYIESYINEVHEKLYSEDFADIYSDNYYENYLDVDSFVDWLLLEEFAKNTDSNFFASCYMYYNPEDCLIHMGPAWDFDLSFGNSKMNCQTTGFLSDEKGVLEDKNGTRYAYRGNWLCRLREDPNFVNKVSARWKKLLPEIKSYFGDEYLERVEEVQEDAEFNFKRWNILGTQIWLSPEGYDNRTTYQSELDYFMQWKQSRTDWLNSELQ